MKKVGILAGLFIFCALVSHRCWASGLELEQTVSTNIVPLETNLTWTLVLTNSSATAATNTGIGITYNPALQTMTLISATRSGGVSDGLYSQSFIQPTGGTPTAHEGPSGMMMPPGSSVVLVYSGQFKTNQTFSLSSSAAGYFDGQFVSVNASNSIYALRTAPRLRWVNVVGFDYRTNRLTDPQLSWEYYEGQPVSMKQASTLAGPWNLLSGACITNHPFTNVVSITASVPASGIGFYRVEKP